MLFNQQQCFIYSTTSFLSKLRVKKVEKLRNSHKTASTNDGLPGTTISGFADNKNIKKLIPTLDFFDM